MAGARWPGQTRKADIIGEVTAFDGKGAQACGRGINRRYLRLPAEQDGKRQDRVSGLSLQPQEPILSVFSDRHRPVLRRRHVQPIGIRHARLLLEQEGAAAARPVQRGSEPIILDARKGWRDGGETAEQPVRFTVGPGRKVERVRLATIAAIAEGERP